jgi:hypothetical protein
MILRDNGKCPSLNEESSCYIVSWGTHALLSVRENCRLLGVSLLRRGVQKLQLLPSE